MGFSISPARPKLTPVLDPDFRPIVLEHQAFLKAVDQSDLPAYVSLAVERENGQIAVYHTKIFAEVCGMTQANFEYLERLLKTVLWIKGGWKVFYSGPETEFDLLKQAYQPGGIRAFDAEFMTRVYEQPFQMERVSLELIPFTKEMPERAGGNLNGCRIGFDAGGSDRKVAAVQDGVVVYSEEVVWHPKLQSDPGYHLQEIRAAMRRAAEHLPRVDGIGVSSAGVFINNRVMVASLFIKVPQTLFDEQVKDIYLTVGREFGDIPVEVRNDGDVTALAGAMSLRDARILGIAMGTSEAAGYINAEGQITGCLNELAFVPVDLNPQALTDEWSGDFGCGVKYFSQDAVIKLAPTAGIELDPGLSPAEKLKVVQQLMEEQDTRARRIYETIGTYLGYSIAYYAQFYDIKHLLILGRVTSGPGGNLIITTAEAVLEKEFPALASDLTLHLPDESDRRVGQAIAAASLPRN